MSNKTKIILATIATAILIFAANRSDAAVTSIQNSGTCFNGSEWTLFQNRNNNKVTSKMVVSGLPPKSKWNINYSYSPIYVVRNFGVTADKKGRISFQDTQYSSRTLTTFVWVDAWGIGINYCFAGGSL